MDPGDRFGNILDALHETIRIRSTSEPLTESADLTQASAGRFVVYHERLPVGHRSSSPHAHSSREEFIFVLQGTPTIFIDGKAQKLQVGDYVALAAGSGRMHYLRNDGSANAEYLFVASIATGDVIDFGDVEEPGQISSKDGK